MARAGRILSALPRYAALSAKNEGFASSASFDFGGYRFTTLEIFIQRIAARRA